jgi:hypothetical protein
LPLGAGSNSSAFRYILALYMQRHGIFSLVLPCNLVEISLRDSIDRRKTDNFGGYFATRREAALLSCLV